eukprot:SAG31_NODE_370_length_16651_cov_3.511056_17_plen_160_part_00
MPESKSRAAAAAAAASSSTTTTRLGAPHPEAPLDQPRAMRGFASALVLLDLRLASAGPLPPKRKLQQQEAVKGPGAGPWELAAPETYGMNAEALERAFIELESSTPNRYCSIVAKEGKLVHERYNPDHQRVERNGRGAGALYCPGRTAYNLGHRTPHAF